MKNDRPNKKRQGYRVTATVVPQPHGIEPNAEQVMNIVEGKFNRQLYNNRLEGYGFVLYPKK
jgi:hypothetical protein